MGACSRILPGEGRCRGGKVASPGRGGVVPRSHATATPDPSGTARGYPGLHGGPLPRTPHRVPVHSLRLTVTFLEAPPGRELDRGGQPWAKFLDAIGLLVHDVDIFGVVGCHADGVFELPIAATERAPLREVAAPAPRFGRKRGNIVIVSCVVALHCVAMSQTRACVLTIPNCCYAVGRCCLRVF